MTQGQASPSPTAGASGGRTARVSAMFGRISHRYDLMNRLMSGGRDQVWRRLTAERATREGAMLALDVATGTADLALALREHGCRVVGLDPCSGMVRLGREKPGAGTIAFALGDAHALPFKTGVFDCLTVAFGVRNMADPVLAFTEMRRVLVPGGRLACLEIMPPGSGLIGRGYQLYLNRFIPWLGGWVSGEPDAYHYLSGSVMAFSDPAGLKVLMEAAGFSGVCYRLHQLGAIAIHEGEKR